MYYECESWWWLDAEILTKEEIGCVLCYTYMYYILYYYHRERYGEKNERREENFISRKTNSPQFLYLFSQS